MKNIALRYIFILVTMLAFLLVGCGQIGFATGSPTADATQRNNDLNSGGSKSAAAQDPTTNALAIVRAFNDALSLRDTERALQFLSNDVTFVDQRNSPNIHSVISGWHSIAALLRNLTVLSHAAGEYQVKGNRVTYTLTEWLDPRIVGPNYPQPRTSHVIAVAEYGQITTIIMVGDSEWIAERDNRADARTTLYGQ